MLELGPKMAGLYHITIEQAYLKAEIVGDNVKLQVKIRLLQYEISIPTKIFFALETKNSEFFSKMKIFKSGQILGPRSWPESW